MEVIAATRGEYDVLEGTEHAGFACFSPMRIFSAVVIFLSATFLNIDRSLSRTIEVHIGNSALHESWKGSIASSHIYHRQVCLLNKICGHGSLLLKVGTNLSYWTYPADHPFPLVFAMQSISEKYAQDSGYPSGLVIALSSLNNLYFRSQSMDDHEL